jgi:hypothetical protein
MIRRVLLVLLAAFAAPAGAATVAPEELFRELLSGISVP